MKRRTMLAVILTVALCLCAASQTETYYVVEDGPSAQVVEVGIDGSVVRVVATLPQGFVLSTGAHLPANDGIMLAGIGTTGYDVLSVTDSGVLSTLLSSASIGLIRHLLHGLDGELLIFQSSKMSDIYALRGSTLTTVTRNSTMFVHGVAHDPRGTGLLMCRGLASQSTYGYWCVDPRTGARTTFYTDPVNPNRFILGGRDIHYDAVNDRFLDFVIERTNDTSFLALSGKLGTLSTTHIPNAFGVDLPRASGRSFPIQFRMLSRVLWLPQPYALIDLRADGTELGRRAITGVRVGALSPCLRRGGLHLKRGLNAPPNDRSLALSFPGESGRPYLALLSASGTRPGIGLPDGRVVSIVPDALTASSANGGIPGILGPTVGRLDAQGRAGVRVNGNPFGSTVRGLALHVVVIVLDPQASSGIAHVVGPTVLRMR